MKYPLKCLGLSEERAAVRLKANCNIWSSESIGFALVLGIAVALCKPVAFGAFDVIFHDKSSVHCSEKL